MPRKRTKKYNIGDKFGRLTIIAEAGYQGTGRCVLCRCDCGNEKVMNMASLTTNQPSRSCGCLKAERDILQRTYPSAKNKRQGTFLGCRIQGIRGGAAKRGITYALTNIEAAELILGDCNYCGNPSVQKPNECNGIDRVDSSAGYELSNCVPCCIYCNQAKSNMTMDQFRNWLQRVYLKTNQGI